MVEKKPPFVKDREWFYTGWLMIFLGAFFILIIEEHLLIAGGWIVGGVVACRIGLGLNTEEHGDSVRKK